MSFKNLDDLKKLYRPLLKGVDNAGVLSRETLEHFDNYVAKNAADFENPDNFQDALSKWQKELTDDMGEDLTNDAIRFLNSSVFRIIANPKRLKALGNFGADFNNKFYSSTNFTRSAVDDGLEKLAQELGFGKEAAKNLLDPLRDDLVDLIKKRDMKIQAFADKHFSNLGADEALEKSRKAWEKFNAKKLAEEEAAAARANSSANEAAKATNQPSAKPESTTNTSEAKNTSASNADEAAEATHVSSPLPGAGGKVSDIKVPLAARSELWAKTGAAWRSWGLFALHPYRTAWNAIWGKSLPHQGLSFFGKNVRQFIDPATNVFDEALQKTGAFIKITQLESEMKKVAHAFDKGTDYINIATGKPLKIESKDDLINTMRQVHTHFANDPEFVKALNSMDAQMVKIQNYIDNDIRVLDIDADKYDTIAGMSSRQHELLAEWAETNRKMLKAYTDPDQNANQYVNAIEKKLDLLAENTSGRTKRGSTESQIVNTAVDDLYGRHMGSWASRRIWGTELIKASDGGFTYNKTAQNAQEAFSQGQYGENVTKLDRDFLQLSIELNAYNPEIRMEYTIGAGGGNVGAKAFGPSNFMNNQFNEKRTGLKDNNIDDGPLDTFTSSFTGLFDFEKSRGDILAHMQARLLSEMQTKNAIDTKKGIRTRLKRLNDPDPYRARSWDNLVKDIEFTLDSDEIGSARDIGHRYLEQFHSFLITDYAESGLPNKLTSWKQAINPTFWQGKTIKYNDRCSPAYDLLQQKTLNIFQRGLGYVTGFDIQYFGKMKELKESKGKVWDPNEFEQSWKFFGGAPGRFTKQEWDDLSFIKRRQTSISPAPLNLALRSTGLNFLNPFSKFDTDMRLINWPFVIKPVKTALEWSSIAATGVSAVSAVQYRLTNKEDRAEFGDFAVKEAVQWAKNASTPLRWFSNVPATITGHITAPFVNLIDPTIKVDGSWIRRLKNDYVMGDKFIDNIGLKNRRLNSDAVARLNNRRINESGFFDGMQKNQPGKNTQTSDDLFEGMMDEKSKTSINDTFSAARGSSSKDSGINKFNTSSSGAYIPADRNAVTSNKQYTKHDLDEMLKF